MSHHQLYLSTKKEFIRNTCNKNNPMKIYGLYQDPKSSKVSGILNNKLNKTLFKLFWTWFHMKFFNFKPCSNLLMTGIILKFITINPIKSYFLLSHNLPNWWEERQHWNLFSRRETRMNRLRTYKSRFHKWRFKCKIGRNSSLWLQQWLQKDRFLCSRNTNNWNITK